MINIIFIYLCFWVFISSCFIRWVVSLNKTTHFDMDKEAIENKCIAQKEQIEILVQEVQRLQLKEVKSYENINTSKIIKDLTGEGIVVYCPEFNRNVLFRMNDKEIEKYNR